MCLGRALPWSSRPCCSCYWALIHHTTPFPLHLKPRRIFSTWVAEGAPGLSLCELNCPQGTMPLAPIPRHRNAPPTFFPRCFFWFLITNKKDTLSYELHLSMCLNNTQLSDCDPTEAGDTSALCALPVPHGKCMSLVSWKH